MASEQFTSGKAVAKAAAKLISSEHYLVPSYNFMLLVDGAFEIPLKSVQPFARENEYEPIQEGGMNDYVYLKRKPISQPFKLVIERYVDYKINLADPLSNGTELLLPLLLFVGNNTGGSCTYTRYYIFTGAVVMGKQYGGLDAEKSGLLTETITLGYNHMFCTNLPLSEDVVDPAWRINDASSKRYSVRGFEPDANKVKAEDLVSKAVIWEFDGKKAEGKGTHSLNNKMGEYVYNEKTKKMDRVVVRPEQRKYLFGEENNPNYKPPEGSEAPVSTRSAKVLPKSTGAADEKVGSVELTADQMAAAAFKYEWSKDKKEFTGNGKRSAKLNNPTDEKRAADMRKGAKMWAFDEKTKGGKGGQYAQNYLVTSRTTLPDGSTVGLGIKEDPVETYVERAAKSKGAKNTDNKTDGNTGIAPRKWRFDEQEPATKDGQGDRSRQNAIADDNGTITGGIGVAEVSRDKMAAASHKWAFGKDKNVKDGNAVQSAKKAEGITEESQEDLGKKAKKWGFNEKEKDGDGNRSRQNAVSEGEGDDAKTSGLGVTELDKGKMSEGSKKWEFTNEYSKDGGGVASRVPPKEPELSKTDLEKKAAHHSKNTNNGTEGNTGIEPRRWDFDEKEPATKAGRGNASRVPPKTPEPTQADVAQKAVHGAKNTDNHTDGNTGIKPRKWNFDEKEPATKAGQGDASRVPAKPAEPSQADMAKKAVRHVKQSITDFLMG